MWRAALLCLALAGCGSAEEATQDLSVAAYDLAVPADLSVHDLALQGLDFYYPLGPVDLAGWCAGLDDVDAGNADCVRQYFLPFAECYRPTGACLESPHNRSTEFCWSDTAWSSLGNPVDSPSDCHRQYKMKGRMCLYAFAVGYGLAWPTNVTPDAGSATFCVSTPSSECTSSVGTGSQFATYDGTTFTCPDGTQVPLDFHRCPALLDLLASKCTNPQAGACNLDPPL